MLNLKRYFLMEGADGAADGGAGSGSAGNAQGDNAVGAGGNDGGGNAGGAGGNAGGTGGAGNGDQKSGNVAPSDKSGEAAGFTDKWRETLAKGDQKKIERLSRYAAPEMVADALFSVQERISKGELRSNTPFPDKGTAEEQAAWRQEHGIPAAPDKYELTLPQGVQVLPQDKELIGGLQAKLHSANAPPAVVSAAVDFYYEMSNQAAAKNQERDTQAVQQTRDSLIAEMGLPEFKANENLVNGLLDLMPAAVKDLFKMGRLADGTPMYGGNADVFKGLAAIARAVNPAGALVPGQGGNAANAIADEIAAIEKKMGTDEYIKDEKMQERYRKLISARDRVPES